MWVSDVLVFDSTSWNVKQLEDAICTVRSAELFYMGSLTQTTVTLKSLMKLNMEFGPVSIWNPAWMNVLTTLFWSLLITFLLVIIRNRAVILSCCFHISPVILTLIFSADNGLIYTFAFVNMHHTMSLFMWWTANNIIVFSFFIINITVCNQFKCL